MSEPITYGRLKAAQPDRYTQAATEFQQVADTFEQHSVDLNQQVYQPIESEWTGAAAAAARSAIEPTIAAYNATLDYLNRFVGLMRSGAEGIGDAQAYQQAGEQIAVANGWSVDDVGQIHPGAVAPDRGINEALMAEMIANPQYAEAVDLINRALETAQSVDAQISAALLDPEQFGQGRNWESDAGKSASAAAALESKLVQTEIPAAGTDSATVNAWWSALTSAEQQELLKADPTAIGTLNGIPAVARDEANQIVLADRIKAEQAELRSLTAQEQQLDAEMQHLKAEGKGPVYAGRVGAVTSAAYQALSNEFLRDDEQIAALGGQLATLQNLQVEVNKGTSTVIDGHTVHIPMYLMGFDTNVNGHAIVAVGNPDTAKNVAVYVPGMNATLSGIDGKIGDAANLTTQADHDTDSTSNATVLWLGYNSPQLTDLTEPVLRTGDAQAAVPDLTGFVTSLKQVNKQIDNLTLVGHSYGSLVVGETAAASDLPVNNIVLIASPGVSVDNVDGLHMSGSHVWVGADYDDVISHTQQFGANPATVPFGANQFRVQHLAGLEALGLAAHSQYFDPGSDSLKNMSEIVAGNYGSVSLDHGPDEGPLYNEPGGPGYGPGKKWPEH